MIFDVWLPDFKRAVSLVGGVAKTKLSNPVVENIVLETQGDRLTIAATNLSVSIRTSIEIQNYEQGGSVAVSARLLSQILSVARGPAIKFKRTRRDSAISLMDEAGSGFTIAVMGTDNWPTIIPDVEGAECHIPASVLRDVIRWTAFATSNERSRYSLGGVLLDIQATRHRWVATDGRRLSLIEVNIDGSQPVNALIPAQTLREVLNALPEDGTVKMVVGERRVMFDIDNVTIASTLLENNFPPCEKFIPTTYDYAITFNSSELLHAVRCASLLQSRNPLITIQTLRHGAIKVSGTETEAGYAESAIKADIGSVNAKLHYNANYLIDLLHARLNEQQDTMTLNLVKGSEAGYFIPSVIGANNVLHIIMPMTTRDDDQSDDDTTGGEDEDEIEGEEQ